MSSRISGIFKLKTGEELFIKGTEIIIISNKIIMDEGRKRSPSGVIFFLTHIILCACVFVLCVKDKWCLFQTWLFCCYHYWRFFLAAHCFIHQTCHCTENNPYALIFLSWRCGSPAWPLTYFTCFYNLVQMHLVTLIDARCIKLHVIRMDYCFGDWICMDDFEILN